MSNHYSASIWDLLEHSEFPFFYDKKGKTVALKCPPEGMVADFLSFER